MISAPVFAQLNGNRDDKNLKMSVIWTKMFSLIDDEDWARVEVMNFEVKDLLTHNCKQQEILFVKYSSNYRNTSKTQSKNALAMLIANNITLELRSVIIIKDEVKRRTQLKNLFAELISIQYQLKSIDFTYYRTLFSLIKSMHGSNNDQENLLRILSVNTYFMALNNTCL